MTTWRSAHIEEVQWPSRLEASRIIQVVPGQRVRVSMRSALATGAILVVVGTAAMGRSSSGPTDERLATVRARPDPVQSYQPSSTDSAIRGVANKIWESDHYRSEMMQSFFLWLVCAPLLVLAIFACLFGTSTLTFVLFSRMSTERGLQFLIGQSFYRSESAVSRDLACLAAASYKTRRGHLKILDAFAGSGTRGARYLAHSNADSVEHVEGGVRSPSFLSLRTKMQVVAQQLRHS